jgi:hypothetical protein
MKTKNPKWTVAAIGIAIVLFCNLGIRLAFSETVTTSVLKTVEPYVCPENSQIKMYSSPTTWRDSNGTGHNGTGYSFDCVNSAGNHVDNYIDLAFGAVIVSIIVGTLAIMIFFFVKINKLFRPPT